VVVVVGPIGKKPGKDIGGLITRDMAGRTGIDGVTMPDAMWTWQIFWLIVLLITVALHM
jgi:hypothetical protein